jgi:Na+/melibiose symporter-like transporter
MSRHIYFLPFYFQAVKGTTAEESGIRCIPYLVSITLASIVVGGLITALGPYNPPMWAGVIIFTVGSAMVYTLKVGSGAGMWIGYQILAGVGAGACVQIPFLAVQVVLSEKDMPVGNAVSHHLQSASSYS